MEIKLEEIPCSGNYEFYADNEVHYTFHFKRINKGHNFKIFKNRDMVSNTNAPWLLAPDYEAAKELIEIYLKKAKK